MDGVTVYGFRWGPMEVERATHVEGRGRVVTVKTDHAHLQVYVTEQGRRIRVFDMKKPGDRELTA